MTALQLEGIFTLNFLHCHSPGNFKIFFIYLTAVHSSDCNLFHNILRFHKKKKNNKKKINRRATCHLNYAVTVWGKRVETHDGWPVLIDF